MELDGGAKGTNVKGGWSEVKEREEMEEGRCLTHGYMCTDAWFRRADFSGLIASLL